jgi:putative transposase
MGRGRPRKPIVLSAEVREELTSLSRSRTLSHGLVRRANIILMSVEGLSNRVIAEKVGLSQQSVVTWRNRFLQQGLVGLYDERRSGRPRTVEAEEITALIRKTLTTKPEDGSTQWTCRSIAVETKISKSEVQRIWSTLGIAPHRQKHFKLSNDPFFTEKVHDIVGLYLDPPDCAMVLCVDEKSQTQALERTQPLLPYGAGIRGGRDARLRPPRYHDVVRRPGHCLRRGFDAMQAQAPPPGVFTVSQPHRPKHT